MKEILPIILPFVGGIIAAIIGWCGSEFSRHKANKYNEVQTLNSSLSWMLELYHRVHFIKNTRVLVTEFLNWYNPMLKEVSLSETEIVEVNEAINKMINPIYSSMVSDDLKSICDKYENALSELSKHYPVAVYRLRGRADIKLILADINLYCEKIDKQQTILLGEYMDILAPLQDVIKTTITQNNIDALREEILELARDTFPKQRKEIINALNNMDQTDVYSDQWLDIIKQQIITILK